MRNEREKQRVEDRPTDRPTDRHTHGGFRVQRNNLRGRLKTQTKALLNIILKKKHEQFSRNTEKQSIMQGSPCLDLDGI